MDPTIQALKSMIEDSVASLKNTGKIVMSLEESCKLMQALEKLAPELPKVGDYVRITQKSDPDCGLMAEILATDYEEAAASVQIAVWPLCPMARRNRDISAYAVRVLTPMEVLAEASK